MVLTADWTQQKKKKSRESEDRAKKLSKLKQNTKQNEQTGDLCDHADCCHTHFGRELEERSKQRISEKTVWRYSKPDERDQFTDLRS